MGDIGEHFPDTDEQYLGISSLKLLEEVIRMAKADGYRVYNLDTTIVADYPCISPYKEEMARKISSTLDLEQKMVNIKATSTNGLCLFAKEGIAAYAVVCLEEFEKW